MSTNLIIDASNLVYRIHGATYKSPRVTSMGENVGCIIVALQSIKNLVTKFIPEKVYLCWDRKLVYPSTNFRVELTGDTYKANRPKLPDIEKMFEQIPKIAEIVNTLGCINLFPGIMEGDDIVSWLVHTQDGTNIIVSGDHDFYQLINDNVLVYNLNKKVTITPSNFTEVVGVEKEHFKLYKAILGDASDNIPGIPSYGKIRSRSLARKWDKIDVTPEFKQIVEKNMKIIDLDIGYKYYPEEVVCYEKQLAEQLNKPRNPALFKKLCEQYELREILNSFFEWERLFKPDTIADLIESYFKQ